MNQTSDANRASHRQGRHARSGAAAPAAIAAPAHMRARATIHTLPAAGVYSALETHPDGLTDAEAAERLAAYGPNIIREIKGTPLIWKFLANFTHLMAALLWVGGLIAFIAQMPQLGMAIWMVNLINGAFSFWQEYRAEQATAALRRMLPQYARVRRDGRELRILADELVPGDVLLLAEGDHISADGRLVHEADLRLDQSMLTGEAHPVLKTSEAVLHGNLARAELPNLVFAGTSVVAGTGTAVVITTGMATEFGRIAHLTQSVGAEPSPLQKELRRVTKTVTVLATSLGLLFFVLAIALAGVDLADGFIFAMGIIVAFVPEGMLPTVTLALALGVQRMAKRHALVKRLSAVETLGCTSVICTDKTGTLTQNEMTACAVWLPTRQLAIAGAGYAPEGRLLEGGQPVPTPPEGDLRQLLVAAGLCTDARLLPPDGDSARWTVLGDPTEAALQVLAAKGQIDLAAEARSAPRLHELPFESRRKRMTTIHSASAGRVAYVKGAPNEVLGLSNQICIGGQPCPLDDARRAAVAAANDGYARAGLRVLAVAMRRLPNALADRTAETIERDLTFLGLVALHDPPRPEVAAAVATCHRAGIRIIMITGDYGLTAESIARRIGIIGDAQPRIISGAELDTLDDAQLQAALGEEVLFARVAPEHKLRVVSALQAIGQIVATTGDGVNDAPALKKADIGVAMGVAGTDVAKAAADMILTDDNFASIVNAIEEGRAVYANIRRFATYVFTSNMPEAVPFVALLFSRGAIPLPLTVMQVLAVDLGTDMVPAIGLGAELPEHGVMERPPRSQREPLLAPKLLARALIWYGMIESIAAMAAYFYLNWTHGWPGIPLAAEGTIYRMATTMTLAGIVATQIGAVFDCRTDRTSVFTIGLFTNRLVLAGIASELAILGLLIYTPLLQDVFHTAPIGIREWAFVFAWTPIIFLADEARKALLRRRARQVITR
jgi:magnesium-transporting ATPase (P-type)